MKMLVLLEGRKRWRSKPKSPPDHPDYNVSKRITKNLSMSSAKYDLKHKGSNKRIGSLHGTYLPSSRRFHVAWAGATDAGDAKSPAAEKARKSGETFLPKSAIHHVLKHVRKDFPGATRLTADRVSGANPNHSVDTRLRSLTPKEAKIHRDKKSDVGHVSIKPRKSGITITSKRFNNGKEPGHFLQNFADDHPTELRTVTASPNSRGAVTKSDLGFASKHGFRELRAHLKAVKGLGIKHTDIHDANLQSRRVALDRKTSKAITFKRAQKSLGDPAVAVHSFGSEKHGSKYRVALLKDASGVLRAQVNKNYGNSTKASPSPMSYRPAIRRYRKAVLDKQPGTVYTRKGTFSEPRSKILKK